jgi:hypothetical protein
VRLRAARGSRGVPAPASVGVWITRILCLAPFLVPFLRSRLPPAPSPLRVFTCFLSLSHRGPLSSSSVRYCHSGLFPPRRHRSFLPLSPPHSNVPTVYPPSIRASAHSPSLSSYTSNRSRCANESRKVSKMFFSFYHNMSEYFANLMLI